MNTESKDVPQQYSEILKQSLTAQRRFQGLVHSFYAKGKSIKVNVIYGLLIASMVLIVVNALITYDNIREKELATDQIIHSYRINQSSSQVLTYLTDMETGQRGYILTGDQNFLEFYTQADRKLKQEILTLSDLIDEPTAIYPERKILTLSRNEQENIAGTFEVLKLLGKDSAMRHLNARTVKLEMDSLRSFVKGIVGNEEKRILTHSTLLAKNRKLDPLRFSAFGLIGITCFLAFVTIAKKEKNNNALLNRLIESNNQLEEKVRERTRQLLEANQAKDHFLGIATHDLKSPINGILGLVGLMKRDERERSDLDMKYLDHMEESCKKMQRLIIDVLEVNRIDQGLARIQKESVDLKIFLDKIETDFLPEAERKGITLLINKVRFNPHTDPSALSRILENLLSNAIKFSQAHRTVQLVTTLLNDAVQFEVKDEGPGIADEELPKLFGKFQRLGNKPTSKENSTGLGLSIVKELTALLGGTITVESKLGVGTFFTVIIPC
ncbi:MAG TPA: ATP-binding protein [Chryseolinea sp.]